MLPKLPRLRATCSAQHTLNNATEVAIEWDTPSPIENITYNSANKDFTIDVSGFYFINVFFGFPNLTNTGNTSLMVQRDTGSGFSTVAQIQEPDNPSGAGRLHIEYQAQLNKGDKVRMIAYQVQSPSANQTFTPSSYSFVNIQMLDRL